jgi:hypothetical protein
MTTLVLEHKKWTAIRQRIDADYGIVVGMVSWRLKETLGFTVRHHTGHSARNERWEDDIRLDFANEDAATFFRLKYL